MDNGNGVSRGDRIRVINTGQTWDPEVVAQGTRGRNPTQLAA